MAAWLFTFNAMMQLAFCPPLNPVAGVSPSRDAFCLFPDGRRLHILVIHPAGHQLRFRFAATGKLYGDTDACPSNHRLKSSAGTPAGRQPKLFTL